MGKIIMEKDKATLKDFMESLGRTVGLTLKVAFIMLSALGEIITRLFKRLMDYMKAQERSHMKSRKPKRKKKVARKLYKARKAFEEDEEYEEPTLNEHLFGKEEKK